MCVSDGRRVCISDDSTAEFQLSHEAKISHVDHQQLKICQHLRGSIGVGDSDLSLQFSVDMIRKELRRRPEYVINIALVSIQQLLGKIDDTGLIILKPKIL